MKLGLIYPPLADFTQPYLSLPVLSAFLRSKGHHEVCMVDDNVAFYRTVLTPSFIEDALKKLEDRIATIERKESLEKQERMWYARAALSSLKGSFIINGIEEAIKALTSQKTFSNLATLNNARRMILEAIDLLSTAWNPFSFSPTHSGRLFFSSLKEIEDILSNHANPFYDYFNEHTLKALSGFNAIGISISYQKQILPSLILAGLIKEQMPGVPVIAGGNIPSVWYRNVEKIPELFGWFDYIVAFEGETALETLLTALENETVPDKVPNLVYKQGDKVMKNKICFENLSELPIPDYEGLPMDQYFAPEPVPLLYTTRGCYWSQCNFCSVSPAMKGHFRRRPPQMVLDDIRSLIEKTGARCFAFADDCLPPGTLSSLADLIIEHRLNIVWQGEVRFENSFDEAFLKKLHRAGCRNLIFGLESFSDSVLNAMNKGIRTEKIVKILENCRKSKIAFNLQFFFGFPGETKKEAEMTSRFIRNQAYGAVTFSFGVFELHAGSNVHLNPESFGISIHSAKALSAHILYAPLPDYAEKVRKQLLKDLKSKIKYPYAGLSLNAYTLLFLCESGVTALGNLYGSTAVRPEPMPEEEVLNTSLVPGKNQQIKFFHISPEAALKSTEESSILKEPVIILYDHDMDKTVEITPFAYSLIQGLNNGLTLTGLRENFLDRMGEASLNNSMNRIFDEVILTLYDKGFLQAAYV